MAMLTEAELAANRLVEYERHIVECETDKLRLQEEWGALRERLAAFLPVIQAAVRAAAADCGCEMCKAVAALPDDLRSELEAGE